MYNAQTLPVRVRAEPPSPGDMSTPVGG